MNFGQNKHGFTILESILALAVFGLLLIGLITALNEAGKGINEAIEIEQIVSKMRSIMTKKIQSTIINTKSYEINDNNYIFFVNITPYEAQNQDDEELTNLFEISISTKLSDGQKLKVNSLAYSPAFSTLKIR